MDVITTGSANTTIYMNSETISCSTYNAFSETCLWIICLLTLCSNTLTIVTMLKTKKGIGYKGKLYITSLSLADALIAPLIAFDLILSHLHISCGPNYGLYHISMSDTVEKKRLSSALIGFFYIVSIITSLFTLCSIAADRLLAISKPLVYKNYVTAFRIKCLLSAIWAYVFTVPAGTVMYFAWKVTPERVFVSFDVLHMVPDWWYNYFLLPHSYVALVANFILYGCTLYRVRKLDQHNNAIKAKTILKKLDLDDKDFERSKRFLIMAVATLCLLLLLWAPYTLVSTIIDFRNPDNPRWFTRYLWPLTYSILYCNSWVNPLLFCWLNKDYRKAYMTILRLYKGKHTATVHDGVTTGSDIPVGKPSAGSSATN